MTDGSPSPSGNGSVSTLAEGTPPVSPTDTTTPSRRSPDYRLRGLDLPSPVTHDGPTRPKKKHHPYRRRQRRRLLKWGVVVTLAALVAVILRLAVVQPFSVPSSDMSPTLQGGDHILVLRPSFLTGPIGRGEIVVFRHPAAMSCGAGGQDAQDLVKRVIALPGDTIWSSHDTIYVDGRPLREAGWYSAASGQVGSTPIARTTIPSHDYFVMGDNRTNSCDSRSFGAVPASAILGKVVAIDMRASHPYLHIF